ncbi:MAG: hypothetical protein OQL08_12580 [Gammaproteobacteria bacterium]|nr:hypothetical protein [Gammaproteobacteria bacterium]
MKPSPHRIMRVSLLLCLLLPWQGVWAVELTGRFAMLGTTARAEAGDWGHQETAGDLLSADQQGLRLMLEEGGELAEWSAHLRLVRTHTYGLSAPQGHSSELFRYTELGGTLLDEGDETATTVVRYELDRLAYRRQFSHSALTLGRQPIDWGSGRFWQPLNLFGSFAPTDLDTDYKPGIDSVALDYFPSPFSSLSAVYALAPQGEAAIKDSGALHYRRQVGELSEVALVAGSISGNTALGGSFESAWQGIGWRIEGVHYWLDEMDEQVLFWIAGLDYQFANGTLLSAEYYDNSRGAVTQGEMAEVAEDPLLLSGLQQQLSRRLVGLGLARDLTPLLHGGYTLLGALLEDDSGAPAWSLLHQFNLTYSVSNESDLLLSLLLPEGRGLSSADEPRSEFGHIPAAFTLRLRFYF